MSGDTVKSDEWRLKQAQTIGGSNAGAAVGKGRFKTRAELYDQMTQARNGIVPTTKVTDDMRRGTLLEPVARQLLSETLQHDIAEHDQADFVTNQRFPWAHVLPDGHLPDGGLVEIKVPRPATLTRISMNGLPDDWRLQCIHGCAILAVPYAILGIMDPVSTRLEHFRIEPTQDEIDELMGQEEVFMSFVDANMRPEDIVIAQPDDDQPCTGLVTLDTPEVRKAAEQYVYLKRLVGDAADVLEAAQQRLLEATGGDFNAFEIPGLLRVYHRPQAGNKVFNKAKAIAKYPDLAGDEYLKQSAPSRPFKAYILEKQ